MEDIIEEKDVDTDPNRHLEEPIIIERNEQVPEPPKQPNAQVIMRCSFKTPKHLKILKPDPKDEVFLFWDSFIPLISIIKYKYAKKSRITRLLIFGISIDELMFFSLTYFRIYAGKIENVDLVFGAFVATPVTWVCNYLIGFGLWIAFYFVK